MGDNKHNMVTGFDGNDQTVWNMIQDLKKKGMSPNEFREALTKLPKFIKMASNNGKPKIATTNIKPTSMSNILRARFGQGGSQKTRRQTQRQRKQRRQRNQKKTRTRFYK